MKNLLCLDFDGVICNSINECLLVTYNCYFKIIGDSNNQAEEIAGIPIEIRERFYNNRYLVRPAKDYFLLMKLVLEGNSLIEEEYFNNNLVGMDGYLDEFEKLFFYYRENMIKEKLHLWLSLNPIYNEFLDYYNKNNEREFYIVTNKNRVAVEVILENNKIKFNSENIFAKENFTTKESALKEIAILNNLKNSQILFVDDSPATIKELTQQFPNSYLANWGYYKNNSELIKSINKFSELY